MKTNFRAAESFTDVKFLRVDDEMMNWKNINSHSFNKILYFQKTTNVNRGQKTNHLK